METDDSPSLPPALVVKRGRLGNFQFSLATKHGRLNGSVTVAVRPGQPAAEAEELAYRKIAALSHALVTVAK